MNMVLCSTHENATSCEFVMCFQRSVRNRKKSERKKNNINKNLNKQLKEETGDSRDGKKTIITY